MRRTVAIIAVLAMGLPALSLAWMPEAGAFTPPPLILPHSGSVVFDNFTGTQMTNLSLNETGAAGLDESSRFWGTGLQLCPDTDSLGGAMLSAASGGRFVAIWIHTDVVNQHLLSHVFAQLFDVQGNKVGDQIPVVTGTDSAPYAAVAMGPQGDFIVGWITWTGSEHLLQAQRFDRDGKAVGSRMTVSSSMEYMFYLTAAASADGNYLLVWRDDRDGGAHIRARMVSKQGTFPTDDIQVTGGTENQDKPQVEIDTHGRAVIAFTTGTNNINVAAQRLDDKGLKISSPVGPALGSHGRMYPMVCIDPWDNFLLSWEGGKDQSNGADISGQKYDPAGAPSGGEMTLVGDAGDQYMGYTGYDPDGNLLVAWTDDHTGNNETYAKIIYRRGVTRPVSVDLSSSQYTQDFVSDLVATPDGDFMVLWTSRHQSGYNYTFGLFARPLRTSHLLSGTLVTGPIAPDNIWKWGSLTADIKFSNPSTNSVVFHYSTDDGANWTPVPSGGDLSAAGRAPIRIKAVFSTIDNVTTPVLKSLTVKYTKNIAPSVSVLGPSTVKKGANVTITSNVSDGDFLDQFSVTYKWTQTAGKNYTLVNATGQNLSFKADKAGTFTFRLVVNDGYNDSAPATMTVKVTETRPPAKSGFEWVLVLGAAVGIAAIIRRRRT
jgi:hypothetical protein